MKVNGLPNRKNANELGQYRSTIDRATARSIGLGRKQARRKDEKC